jgi:hypothetical protein
MNNKVYLLKKTIRFLAFLLLVIWAQYQCFSQEKWELKKDKDGVQVYILEDNESEFNPYKSVAIMEGNILNFESLLKDSPRMTEWSESVVKVEILREIGDSIQVYYSIADAPFPIKNRDGIYQNSFSWSNDKKVLTVDVQLLPDFIEKNEEYERVSGWGYWRIEDVGKGKIEVVCEMHIHPGGSIPAWLANAFADKNPYNNMMKLKEILNRNN